MDQSLNLFVELSNGYSSVRNLRKSETVKMMLVNDPSNHFPFLETAPQSKNRTKYYAALARILFSGDVEVHDADFHNFGIEMLYYSNACTNSMYM
jgi:exportin-7